MTIYLHCPVGTCETPQIVKITAIDQQPDGQTTYQIEFVQLCKCGLSESAKAGLAAAALAVYENKNTEDKNNANND